MSAKVRRIQNAWWVVIHHDGNRRKKRIGPTQQDRRQAQKIAELVNARLVLGMGAFPQEKREALAFDAYSRRWLRSEVLLPQSRGLESALSDATGELHERHLRRYLVPHFADRDLSEIGVAEVQAFYDRCLETGCPPSERSVEMVITTLRRILAFAEARGEIGRNPVEVWKRSRGRRRRGAGTRKPNVLSSRELEALLEAAETRFPDTFPLILFLADTGARLGEALALQWTDVDLAAGRARICRSFSSGKRLEATKTGRERSVELSSRLRDTLEAGRPTIVVGDALCFPNERGDLVDPHNFRNRVFRPLVALVAGHARRFTPHGLRHTFASLHMARGTPLLWIQQQGGWASAKVLLDTYGHFLAADSSGHADALSSGPRRPYTALGFGDAPGQSRHRPVRIAKRRARTARSPRSTSWARPGSNGGPPACKAGALAN